MGNNYQNWRCQLTNIMKVIDSGFVYKGIVGSTYGDKSIRRTHICTSYDNTLYVSFRRGTDHESIDGHPVVMASTDEGVTWELRYNGYGHGELEGIPGQVMSLSIHEIKPGILMGTSLWIDHSDPSLPFMNPSTSGLLPEKIFHVLSTDGARNWSKQKIMTSYPHVATSPCANPVLRLSNGKLAQPYETHKEWQDSTPLKPMAFLRLSTDNGQTWPDWIQVAADPKNIRYYWDQRIAVDIKTGLLIGMFWTHHSKERLDLDVHIAWGSKDASKWTNPIPTGLPGQHCQPVILPNQTVIAIYSDRVKPGISASISHDFGKTWDRDKDLLIYTSSVGLEPGVGSNLDIQGQWQSMVQYRFGHPRAILLPSGKILAVWYAGDDHVKNVHWAKIDPEIV